MQEKAYFQDMNFFNILMNSSEILSQKQVISLVQITNKFTCCHKVIQRKTEDLTCKILKLLSEENSTVWGEVDFRLFLFLLYWIYKARRLQQRDGKDDRCRQGLCERRSGAAPCQTQPRGTELPKLSPSAMLVATLWKTI